MRREYGFLSVEERGAPRTVSVLGGAEGRCVRVPGSEGGSVWKGVRGKRTGMWRGRERESASSSAAYESSFTDHRQYRAGLTDIPPPVIY